MEGVLVFIGCMVLLDALFGERGLVEMMKKRDESKALALQVTTLREQNERLVEEIQKLRDDPATIEDLAKRDLGMIKPGEKLFIIRDLPPTGR